MQSKVLIIVRGSSPVVKKKFFSPGISFCALRGFLRPSSRACRLARQLRRESRQTSRAGWWILTKIVGDKVYSSTSLATLSATRPRHALPRNDGAVYCSLTHLSRGPPAPGAVTAAARPSGGAGGARAALAALCGAGSGAGGARAALAPLCGAGSGAGGARAALAPLCGAGRAADDDVRHGLWRLPPGRLRGRPLPGQRGLCCLLPALPLSHPVHVRPCQRRARRGGQWGRSGCPTVDGDGNGNGGSRRGVLTSPLTL